MPDDGIERPFKVTIGFKGGTVTSFRCSAFRIKPNRNGVDLDRYEIENSIPQILHLDLTEMAWITSLDLTTDEPKEF